MAFKNHIHSSTSTSKTIKNVFFFAFVLSFVSFEIWFYARCSLDPVRNQTSNIIYLLQSFQRKSKVHLRNRWRSLNFDQWKTFSKNYKAKKIFVYTITKNKSRWRVFSNSKEVSQMLQHNMYSTLNPNCHIKPICFLWRKLFKDLLLVKYTYICLCSLNLHPLMSW